MNQQNQKTKAYCKLTATAKDVKTFALLIEPFVTEAKIKSEPGGLLATFVDPAHVLMGIARLRPHGFDSSGDDFGLDVELLKDRVGSLDQKEDVVFHLDDDRLTLAQGRFTRSLSLVDTSMLSDPKMPPLDVPVKVGLPAKDFVKALKLAREVADHVRFTAKDGVFTVRAEGDTTNDEATFDEDVHGEGVALYSIDYLTSAVKACALVADGIELEYDTDYPLKMKAAGGILSAEYLLAPRIER